jgi:predicted solute-binding protein
MNNVTTIEFDGKNVQIDQKLFQGYLKEAFEHLGAIEEADQLFKEVVETVAETTGLKKAKVSKYLKERHAAKTKATRELGQLFEALDDVVEG